MANSIDNLPATPAVTFHRDLGKKYRNVDFDYAAFDSLASRLKLEPHTINDLNIEILPRGGIVGIGGRYSPKSENGDKNKIQISVGGTVNNSLEHELQHAVDDQNGNLKMGPRYILGVIGTRFTGTSVGLFGSSLLYGELGMKAMEDIRGISGGLAIAFGAAAVFGYYLHPLEIKARQTAREHDSQIITYS